MSDKNRLKVPGEDLVETVKHLVQRGNARRVCLLQDERRVLEIPALGDPAAPATVLGAPVLAALKAFGSLVAECTVEIEEPDKAKKDKT